jgi:hypothetical protein
MNYYKEKLLDKYDDEEEGIIKFSIAFGSVKSLVSEASYVVLDENRANGLLSFYILLKTKLAPIRENYDDYLHREI